MSKYEYEELDLFGLTDGLPSETVVIIDGYYCVEIDEGVYQDIKDPRHLIYTDILRSYDREAALPFRNNN